MANLFSSFLERQLNPIVQARAEAILKDNRGYIAGAIQAAPVTLRDSIGAPTDTDHALLYAIYRMHVDVNACVNKWMSGVTGGGWRIVHADPSVQPDDAFLAQLDETQMWLRNPNPFKPFGLIIQEVVQHLAISGDAFLYASRQGDREGGRILELWPLNPSTMTIVASDRGEVVGYVQKVNGKRAEFEPWQILHFRLANPFNDLYGESPLASALEDVGLDLQAMRSNRAIFANGFKPSMLLTFDPEIAKTLEQQKTVMEMIREKHVGEGKEHQVAALPGIKSTTTYGNTLKDMEFVALRSLSTDKITTAYRIPKVLLGYHNAGDYASTRTLYLEAHESTFRPIQQLIAEKLTEDLLQSINQDFRFEFIVRDLADPEQRRADLLAARRDGIITRNEVRTLAFALEEIDGLDDEDVPAGDDVVDPTDTPDAPVEPTTDTPDDTQKAVTKALTADELEATRDRREAILDTLEAGLLTPVQTYFQTQEGRYLDTLMTTFKALPPRLNAPNVRKGVIDDLVDGYLEGNDGDTELGITLFAELEPAAQAGADEAQLQIGFTLDTSVARAAVDEYLLRNALTHAKGINETTREQLRDGLREGIAAGEGIPELRERVKSVFTEASTNRANTIARTETAQAFEAVNLAAMQASGVVDREVWLTAKDDRVRPEHRLREGLEVPIGTDWGGIRPGQEINCVVEGQEVLALDVRKKFRAKYSGPVIRFATHSGAGLTVTMNHPMLTGRGWIPASQVKKGDNFVNTHLLNKEMTSSKLDIHPIKALIEEVLVPEGRVVRRVPVATADFHGDGAFCEDVDVIGSDSSLRSNNNVSPHELIKQGNLVRTPLSEPSFVRDSAEQTGAPRVLHVPACSMSCDGVGHALLGGSGSSEEAISVQTIADLDALASKPASKSDAGNTHFLGELIDRSAGLVSFDEVINIECVRDFSGHVYDLETDHGWYICNDIITHNCRCTSIGILKEDI